MLKEIFDLREKLEQSEYVALSVSFQRDCRGREVTADVHLENDSFIKFLKNNKHMKTILEYDVWGSVASEPACLSLPLSDDVVLKALWSKDELIDLLRERFAGKYWEQQALELIAGPDCDGCTHIQELNTSIILDICILADVWELGE